jgi:DNA-binding transcriptional regulator YdaS (Cro superfamily)
MDELQALRAAVNQAGGQSALARKLGKGVTQAHVWYWLNKAKRAPADKVLAIEGATKVSKHDLRPDLYPEAA